MAQLSDLADKLDKCAFKIAFITSCFAQPNPTVFELSCDSETGLYLILRDIEAQIKITSSELMNRQEDPHAN